MGWTGTISSGSLFEVAGGLDMTALEAPGRPGKGRPGYDPRMLAVLLTCAYCQGVRSSRKIEERCRTGSRLWLADPRVQGELAKLGHPIAASAVWQILHDAGIGPALRVPVQELTQVRDLRGHPVHVVTVGGEEHRDRHPRRAHRPRHHRPPRALRRVGGPLDTRQRPGLVFHQGGVLLGGEEVHSGPGRAWRPSPVVVPARERIWDAISKAPRSGALSDDPRTSRRYSSDRAAAFPQRRMADYRCLERPPTAAICRVLTPQLIKAWPPPLGDQAHDLPLPS